MRASRWVARVTVRRVSVMSPLYKVIHARISCLAAMIIYGGNCYHEGGNYYNEGGNYDKEGGNYYYGCG